MAYTKKLAAYVSDLDATFLGFSKDVEALDQLDAYDLDRLLTRTEAACVRMVQNEDM